MADTADHNSRPQDRAQLGEAPAAAGRSAVPAKRLYLRPPLFGDLVVAPFAQDLGSPRDPAPAVVAASAAPIEGCSIRGYRLVDLYLESHPEIPDADLLAKYEPWLIVHELLPLDVPGGLPVLAIGYEAHFGEGDLYTVEALPGGTAPPSAVAIGLEGQQLGPGAGAGTAPGRALTLGAGCRLALSDRTSVVGDLALDLTCVSAQAVGKGASHVEWLVSGPTVPSQAERITLVQTALVFPGTTELPVRARVSALVQPPHYSVPARLESPWLSTICQAVEPPR
jgi:hypothetical protein